jgi:hypothetical protein
MSRSRRAALHDRGKHAEVALDCRRRESVRRHGADPLLNIGPADRVERRLAEPRSDLLVDDVLHPLARCVAPRLAFEPAVGVLTEKLAACVRVDVSPAPKVGPNIGEEILGVLLLGEVLGSLTAVVLAPPRPVALTVRRLLDVCHLSLSLRGLRSLCL